MEDPAQPDPENDGPGTPDAAASALPPGLSERDVAVLDLEARQWPSPGVKERAIRERLGISPIQYYQQLNALLDDPRALSHAPTTINRLRHTRTTRRTQSP